MSRRIYKEVKKLYPLIKGDIVDSYYVPDFSQENELFKQTGTMNLIDASLQQNDISSYVSGTLGNIENSSPVDTSQVDDKTLLDSVIPNYMDDNEIYEQLNKDMEKERSK